MISAAFAHAKRELVQEEPISSVQELIELVNPVPCPVPRDESAPDFDEPIEPPEVSQRKLPIFIQYPEVNDVYERVTEFHRKRPTITYQHTKLIEEMKKRMENSEGSFEVGLRKISSHSF